MKKILFVDGTKGFYPNRVNEKATGGIITSLTTIPQILAKRGYDPYVLSSYKTEEKLNGVTYINKSYQIDPDIVVYNRNTINKNALNAFKCPKIWWLHDIVDYRYLDDDAFKSVDLIVALSQYNVNSYSDFYDIPKNKFVIIPNGVDKKKFYFGNENRNPHLFLTVSAPVKGHQPLEFAYHNLKRHDKDIDFRVYSSQKLHDFEDSKAVLDTYDRYQTQGIKVQEPVSQEQLSDLFRSARALLMPNHYPEICSNVLLQAQSCGCPVIASNIGSVGEFIEHGKTGLLTKTYPHDKYWWWKDFSEQCCKLQQDDELFARISRSATVNVFDWNYVTTLWERAIEKAEKGII